MTQVEQLEEDTVNFFFARPTREGVQESNMRNLLVEHPTDVAHRKALTCLLLTRSDGERI